MSQPQLSMPIGVVVRKSPGATRWAKWCWKAVAILPGAPDRHWHLLRQDGEVSEFHAATAPLDLYRTDTEAYLTGISARVPTLGIVMREGAGIDPLDVVLVTASPYETQDYLDSGEDIVELVPMTEGLIALIRDFCAEHHEEEAFIKRRRDKKRIDLSEDGKGDARIKQLSDVYRAPRHRALQ
ncbi:MAG: DUF3305 domain-containing protein [Pseudomonadota bacterium]